MERRLMKSLFLTFALPALLGIGNFRCKRSKATTTIDCAAFHTAELRFSKAMREQQDAESASFRRPVCAFIDAFDDLPDDCKLFLQNDCDAAGQPSEMYPVRSCYDAAEALVNSWKLIRDRTPGYCD